MIRCTCYIVPVKVRKIDICQYLYDFFPFEEGIISCKSKQYSRHISNNANALIGSFDDPKQDNKFPLED